MTIFLLIITLCSASLLQGITGFGFALIAAPLAFIMLPKETVIISFVIIGLFINSFLSLKIKAKVNRSLIIYLTIFSLLGMPLGIYLLQIISLSLLKIVAGFMAIVFALLFYFTNIKLPKNKIITAVVGFISGVLNTTTSMSGPVVVLLLMGIKMDKNEFRKNLVVFFWLSAIIAFMLFWLKGMITWERIKLGLIVSPFIIFFANLGNKITAKTSPKLFKLLTLGLVFFSGIYCIFSGIK